MGSAKSISLFKPTGLEEVERYVGINHKSKDFKIASIYQEKLWVLKVITLSKKSK